jgi:hypothetical protein
MALPKDLRLMVYERIPRKIVHRPMFPQDLSWRIALIQPCVETAILATNKDVYAEAKPILDRLITNFILKKAPKFLISEMLRTDDDRYCNPGVALTHVMVTAILEHLDLATSGNTYDSPETNPAENDKFLEDLVKNWKLPKEGLPKYFSWMQRFSSAAFRQLQYQIKFSSSSPSTSVSGARFEYVYGHYQILWHPEMTPADMASFQIDYTPSFKLLTKEANRHGVNISVVGHLNWAAGFNLQFAKLEHYRLRYRRRPNFTSTDIEFPEAMTEDEWAHGWMEG